jgi:Ca-activated chloride channel family protein
MMSEPQLSTSFAPVSARDHQTIELAMQRLWLVGRVMPVGARLLVRHTFRSAEKKPLEVIYSFGLPRDASLRRFRITGEGFSVSSDLKPVEEAVKDYEEGLAEGHLAAMARQYGDGLVNLTVGNIRPGEEVAVNLEILAGVESRDDGLRFRFPFTLAPSYHARARAAEVKPGVGEIELPADEFGDLVLPQFASDASALHEVGFDLTVAMTRPIVETGSPSHAVRAVGTGHNRSRVSLATAKDVPNRDLVLDVRTGEGEAGVISGTGKDGKGHFAAVAPSAAFKAEAEGGKVDDEPRRIVFVTDRSGSMGGVPIEQARRAVEACLGALAESDNFGLVAFDDRVEFFGERLAAATRENRDKARAFLAGIDARGGTALAAGLNAAAGMLGKGTAEGGGDILVFTDGQVFGTERILEGTRAAGIRVHCLGIGAASQDRFLAQLARETGGVSRFLTPRERVDLGAVELFASVGRPVASQVEAKVEGFADGYVAPDPPKFVFSGTPVVLFGETSGPGEGRLVLGWEARRGAGKRQSAVLPFAVGAGGDGETLRLLRGARLITDLEGHLMEEGGTEALKKREADRIRGRLVALSQAYGLTSRPMALVAVVKRPGDRPGDLPVTRVVPVGFAQDVMWGGYFADRLMKAAPMAESLVCSMEISDAESLRAPSGPMAHRESLFRGMFGRRQQDKSLMDVVVETSDEGIPGDDSQAALLLLASCIEPDGGMPGKTDEERVQATILALLKFLAGGHNVSQGAFRAHVKRLVEFLEQAKVRTDIVKQVVERARSGQALEGDWAKSKPGPELWKELEAALKK